MIAAEVSDYRELARRRLPRFLFDYLDGGAFSETTLRRNVDDFRDIEVRQRVMRDVSALSTETELFGKTVSMPVALAPVGLSGLYARRGEIQGAKAAHKAGIPFSLSTMSACGVEELAAGAPYPFWFQLYMMRDRGFMRDVLARAREAGASVLLFTVDLPVPGVRYRDMRSGMAGGTPLQQRMMKAMQVLARPEWAWDVGLMGRPHSLGNIVAAMDKSAGVNGYWSWVAQNFDASVTWKDIEAIRAEWSGPLVIKGVLTPEDARDAASAGADGVIVSNHGGRQLDGARSSIRAVGPIADAVGDKLTVLLDGGVRTGLDVVRAVALGAKAVLIGRAWVYGLGARGERGVSEVLDIIGKGVRNAMALTGCASIKDIDRSILDLKD